MFNMLKGFGSIATSNYMNPYALDVIRTQRRDLVYGISHTEELMDLLVTEGVMTAAKRSIVLTIRTRTDQNSRVLDILEARGERACRKFFYPCLMLVEPDLYQRMKSFVSRVNEQVRDTRRQLIGYLLERDRGAVNIQSYKLMTRKTPKILVVNETMKSTNEKEGISPLPVVKVKNEAGKRSADFIHRIAANEEVEQLKELLEDTDVDIVNSSHETLLHVAAERGNLSITELLIQKGARLDCQDGTGSTALHRAANRGHVEIVKLLLKAGAPIYNLGLQGKTPIHLAAENQHLGTVKVLLEEEAKLSERHRQDTFLHMAAREDNSSLAEMLLQSGAPVDALDNNDNTALLYALRNSNSKTVTVLLNAGAKVDSDIINEALRLNQVTILQQLLSNARGALGEDTLGSALFSAVRQNHEEVLNALINYGADVNICNKEGYTPLLLSAELGHTEVFRVLLANQARLDATLSDLSTVLHLGVQGGSVPLIKTLLGKGVDPNTTGPKGFTPLHIAALGNNPELVGVLLKAGAQINAVGEDGRTPLSIASHQGHKDTVIKLLLDKADPTVRDRMARTALHWAVSTQRKNPVVDLLLAAKVNPNTTDNEKRTALHLAVMEGNTDAVTSLLSHKAKVKAKDMNGSTPLHYAAAGGHASVASALLQSVKNKGVEDRNAWRKTPLHVAAEKGHDSVAVLLLRAGAKINATDHSKDTPLHCAVRGGHHDVVKRLLNWSQAGAVGRRNKVNLQATNKLGKTPLQVAEGELKQEHEIITALLKRKMYLIK